MTILASKAITGVLPDILSKRTLLVMSNRFEMKHARRRVRELASSLTRNQVPRKGLGVRVPCPPLLFLLKTRGFDFLVVGSGSDLSTERKLIRKSSACFRVPTESHQHYDAAIRSQIALVFIKSGGQGTRTPNPLRGT